MGTVAQNVEIDKYIKNTYTKNTVHQVGYIYKIILQDHY